MFDLIAKLLPAPPPKLVSVPAVVVTATTFTTAPTPVLHPVVVSAVPDDCLTFIEDEEDGSPAFYVKHYEHFDWPQGASGPTIGVGYDCGYVTRAEASADWAGILPPEAIAVILEAVGRRGQAAGAWVSANRNRITVNWDAAVKEFTTREVPKWLARCRAVLPNFDLLPGECQGALLSLSYNRGTGGYDDPGARDAEMRAIKRAMLEKDYSKIPADILGMQRLWPKGGDLWRRRAHEAAMFEKGLEAAKVAAAPG